MAAFPWRDAGAVSTALENVLRALAEAAPYHDGEASFPHAGIADLHRLGLLAATVPRHLGGLGWGLRDSTTLIARVGGACAATGLVFAMQLSQHAALARNERLSVPLRGRLGRDAVERGALLNALRVEPDLGSPTRGGLPATVLRLGPDGSARLSGHKLYATGAPGLSWMSVWARTDEAAPRVGHVLVPARAEGVRIVWSWDQRGMRGTESHDVYFENVDLPAENLGDLRPPEAWAEPDPLGAAWNAGVLGALYTGIARAGLDWVVGFLRDRRPTGLGAPLATLPRMQERVGEAETLLRLNERLLRSLTEDADRGLPPEPAESGALKVALTDNAARAVEIAASLAGNHAQARANPIERHGRDVLFGRIHVPVADAAFTALGRGVLRTEGAA